MQSRKTQPVVHEPVLRNEIAEALLVDKIARLKEKAKIIDATVGFGGHSSRFVSKGIKVLGIDADKKALEVARQELKEAHRAGESHGPEACPTPDDKSEECFELVWDNFRKIEEIAKDKGFGKVNGILFDLGVSSAQLTSAARGFSFQFKDAPLDMRIDPERQAVTAANLLNALNETQLTNLFSKVLGKAQSKKLAGRLVSYRRSKSLEKVGDFMKVIKSTISGKDNLNPATLPFMALRMAVNSELENLQEALPGATRLLKKGGRLAIISFHSGEDRLIKEFFKKAAEKGLLKFVNKTPIRPKKEEVAKNPRSRSAKLRVMEKI